MSQYQNHIEKSIAAKAVSCLKNFLANHNGSIYASEMFTVPASFVPMDFLQEQLKKFFTDAEVRIFMRTDLGGAGECMPDEIMQNAWCQAKSGRAALLKFFAAVLDYSLAAIKADRTPDRFARRWKSLCRYLALSPLESEIFMLHYLVAHGLLALNSRVPANIVTVQDFTAKCLNVDVADVESCYRGNGKLQRFCCLRGASYTYVYDAYLRGETSRILNSQFFHKNSAPTLPWNYFGELAENHGETIQALLAANMGKKPVNILFYGAPGTGKTSFAAAIAKKVGLTAWNVVQANLSVNENGMRGEYQSDGKVKSAADFRFAALLLSDRQLGGKRGNCLIVDEADAMLTYDKGLLNEVMESMRLPVIWITNGSPHLMSEAVRRRFDYSICFAAPDASQRFLLWQNCVEKFHLKKRMDESLLRDLATRYPVSAGGISLTLGNLTRMKLAKKGIPGMIEKLLKPHCELLGCPVEADSRLLPAKDYSLAGLNVKGDFAPEEIIQAVRNFYQAGDNCPDCPRMNLLFSGAPGTGKTEYVKFLARELGRKVVVRMGSDLLDKFVGESEKNISQSFRQAEAEGAILFLDEIDGMLQSRDRAMHTWEVTQVNELLHQMENFNGVMIGATNFCDRLDPAVMRRFTFKLEFDYLDDSGKRLFFERMFQTKLSDDEARRLTDIPNLAPGDFRTVRQSLFYLGAAIDNDRRLAALEKESGQKKIAYCGNRVMIGF